MAQQKKLAITEQKFWKDSHANKLTKKKKEKKRQTTLGCQAQIKKVSTCIN